MTLSISPTRSGLTTTIVCKRCEHPPPTVEADLSIWVDTNGDVYFHGSKPTDLLEYLGRHMDAGYEDHPIEAASNLDAEGILPIRALGHYVCKTCGKPIRASDNDPWTWQHA